MAHHFFFFFFFSFFNPFSGFISIFFLFQICLYFFFYKLIECVGVSVVPKLL